MSFILTVMESVVDIWSDLCVLGYPLVLLFGGFDTIGRR